MAIILQPGKYKSNLATPTWAERLIDLSHAIGVSIYAICDMLGIGKAFVQALYQDLKNPAGFAHLYRPRLDTIRRIRQLEDMYAYHLARYRADPDFYNRLNYRTMLSRPHVPNLNRRDEELAYYDPFADPYNHRNEPISPETETHIVVRIYRQRCRRYHSPISLRPKDFSTLELLVPGSGSVEPFIYSPRAREDRLKRVGNKGSRGERRQNRALQIVAQMAVRENARRGDFLADYYQKQIGRSAA